MAGDCHVKSCGADEPGAKPCERSLLRFFYAFQVWRRRRSSRNIIRTPSDTNTLRKEPHSSTIHTGNSGSLSGLAKHSSTIPTPKNVSMLLREPCRATIPTRSGESLLALTSCPRPILFKVDPTWFPGSRHFRVVFVLPFQESFFEGGPPGFANEG
jgi:hypothetical protein